MSEKEFAAIMENEVKRTYEMYVPPLQSSPYDINEDIYVICEYCREKGKSDMDIKLLADLLASPSFMGYSLLCWMRETAFIYFKNKFASTILYSSKGIPIKLIN